MKSFTNRDSLLSNDSLERPGTSGSGQNAVSSLGPVRRITSIASSKTSEESVDGTGAIRPATDVEGRKLSLRRLHYQSSDQPEGNLWTDASMNAKYQMKKRTGSWISRTWHFLQTFSLIIIIGIFATLWAVAMDVLVDKLNEARERLTCLAGNDQNECLPYCQCIHYGGFQNLTISSPGEDAGLWFAYFCWSASVLLLGYTLANCVTLTATGSGIPRMKAVLTGQHIHHFLSWRTLLAKSASLVLVYASGIPIGREGPYVHLACCIATLLMRTPVYRRYKQSSARRIDMLTVGLATGVSAAFGAPFGGVVFAVEVVSQYFFVPNLPRMFLAALSGTFIVKMLRSGSDYETFIALFHTEFEESTKTKISGDSFLAIITVGVVCGLTSGVFVRLVAKIVKLRKQYAPDASTGFKRFIVFFAAMAFFLSILNSIVTRVYWNTFPAVRTQRALIDKLFLPGNLLGSYAWQIGVLLVINFFMTAAAITLPIPAGLFIPVLVIGALVGRFVASGACYFQYGDLAVKECAVIFGYEPGVYAVVGAAAFAAGTTRAISTAVIVTEVTGQPHLLLPISLGVLAAYFVANRVSKPVYDALIEANHFPMLPKLSYKLGNSPAVVCMTPMEVSNCLTISSTVRDAYDLLISLLSSSHSRDRRLTIPILVGDGNMRLLGEVQRGALIKFVDRHLGSGDTVEEEVSRRRNSSADMHADVHEHGVASRSGSFDSSSLQGSMGLPLPYAVEDGIQSTVFDTDSKIRQQSGRPGLLVDTCPMFVTTGATLHKVDVLFRSLRLTTLYLVDDRGSFVGTVDREDLVDFGKKN